MRAATITAILLFLVATATLGAFSLVSTVYEVDLSQNPSSRYTSIIHDFATPLQDAITYTRMNVFTPAERLLIIYVLIPLYSLLDFWLLPPEFALEVRGLSRALPGTVPAEFFLLNAAYEKVSACTSIVAFGPRGETYLARNLDLDFAKLMRRLNVRVRYKLGDKYLFECDGVAGFLGGFTCMKSGKFAVAINSRSDNTTSWLDIVYRAFNGQIGAAWLVRQTMLHAEDYKSALRMLSTEPTIRASYFIVAGESVGAVITRSPEAAVDAVEINNETNSAEWYIVQANNDRWNPLDTRTLAANLGMAHIGTENVTLERIGQEVLMVPPVMRQDMTVAMVLSEVISGHMYVYVPEGE